MKIYRHDGGTDDCRLPHRKGEDLSETELSVLGILHYNFPVSEESSLSEVDALAEARNYANRDKITVSPQAMGESYEEKIDMFFREHIHEDEEIRYILNGRGYFDVRDKEDKWLRVQTEPGDLLILPAGIYHRFTVDQDNFIHAMRLFQTSPKWAALYRNNETNENNFRKEYLEKRDSGIFK